MAIYNPKSSGRREFIHDQEILDTIAYAEANKRNVELIDAILDKARPRKSGNGVTCAGLDHREASVLARLRPPRQDRGDVQARQRDQAGVPRQPHRDVRTAVSFQLLRQRLRLLPLSPKNKHIARKKAYAGRGAREVIALQDMGHKRLAIEAGEDPVNNPIEYILDCIKNHLFCPPQKTATSAGSTSTSPPPRWKTTAGSRKRASAPTSSFRKPIKRELFAAAPHRPQARLRLSHRGDGPRHGGRHRRCGAGRAVRAGELSIRICGLLMHAEHLEAVHGVGPHTISVPRIKHADDIDPSAFDNSLGRAVCQDRCLHPHRRALHRHDYFHPRAKRCAKRCWIWAFADQRASRTSVGGYTEEERPHDTEQFDVSDQRTLDEVVNWLMQMGFIPSFCTACYREGRTGDRFMSL